MFKLHLFILFINIFKNFFFIIIKFLVRISKYFSFYKKKFIKENIPLKIF